MTNKTSVLIVSCALALLVSALHVTLGAQAKSVAEGIYSDAQAMRGMTVYVDKCAACHGEDLAGQAGIIPALTGDPWVMNWQGKTVGDLYDKIFMTMPALEPGSLKPEQAADLVSYIFSVSKYPAGAAELAPKLEDLQQIKIEAPKKQTN
jgi:mono/diheme cytochrome c family protein